MHGSLDMSSCVSMSLLSCMLCCCSNRASKVSYAEEFDSELDSDPDDAKKKSKANMAVALMDSTEDLDDEVERVLGHRWVAFETASIVTQQLKEAAMLTVSYKHVRSATLSSSSSSSTETVQGASAM